MGNIHKPTIEAATDDKLLHGVAGCKSGEEALRESEEKFSKLFHATPAILAFTALADGRFIEVNEAFERAFGYRAEEVIGRTSLELNIWVNPADRAGVIKTLDESGKVRDVEAQFTGKSGNVLVGLYSAEIVEIKGEPYLLSLLNDITERKRAEEALQASEERYRQIVETSREGIWSIDRDARTTYVNQQMADMLGQGGEEMVGRPMLDFVDASARCEVAASLERRKRGVREQYEAVLLRKGGEKIWVGISATPIMGGDGEFIGSFAMVSDISDRKRAAAEIEVLNTNLAARASELEIVNEELEAFSSMVSHDLRKPLTAISGYSQVILELCGGTLDGQCRSYLQEVLNGANRMNQLIDTLLNFSHRTRAELRRETVNLSEMAKTIIAELGLTEPQRRVSCTIAEGVVVDGDANLLRVVLDNLLGNAWKYTARNEETVIEFGVAERRGKSACFVRDNGVGFDMAHKDLLFSPFQRLQNAREFEGTGIGLATVQRIVQRHGGQVWAEGEIGKGATFYFSLG